MTSHFILNIRRAIGLRGCADTLTSCADTLRRRAYILIRCSAALIMLCAMLPATALAADTLMLAQKTSTMVARYGRGTVECNLNAQIPVSGNKTLLTQLCERVGEAANKAVQTATGAPLASTSSSADDATVITGGVETAFFRRMVAAVEAGKATGGLTLDLSLNRVYETAKLITFRVEVVAYGAGNTRGQQTTYVSLLKPSGKTLDWLSIIQKKSKARFQKAVAGSMEAFFGVRDWINLRQQLKNAPQTADAFPLPTGPVAVTKDGFVFSYDAGEIAAPEKGQPLGNISLQKAWLWLTPATKKILR